MGHHPRLAEEQLRTLGRLASLDIAQRIYLAGGTAVAFHLAHRSSFDIDLFTRSRDESLDGLYVALHQAADRIEVIGRTEVTLRLRLDGLAVDVVQYPYPLLAPPSDGPADFPVAGLLDLAAMKLAAIARRGLRRDFWDLYAILQTGMTLRDAADAYLARFGLAEPDLYHVMRALTYFDDAERDPVLPEGLTAAAWERFKEFFSAEAPSLLAPR